ncbi:MAG: DUF5105 domain-containing protein [Sporolactobacillus sp.]
MLKQKKMIILSIVLLLLLFTVGGCGKSTGNNKKKNEAESSVASLKIQNGSYVTSEGKANSKDHAALALSISITNHTKESLDLYSGDFSLYDAKNQKVSADNDIYDESDIFKTLESSDLSPRKTVTGNLIFDVAKGKTYELHYQPDVYKGGKKTGEVILKFNTGKYKDPSADVRQATDAYIQAVFFSNNTPAYSKYVANDPAKDQAIVKNAFTKDVSESFDDNWSKQQIDKVYKAYQAASREKGGADVKVYSVFSTHATVEVVPKVLDFDSLSDDVETLKDQFIDDNQGKYSSYDAAVKAWYAYLADHIGELFNKADAVPADDSYKLNLSEHDGKWEINTDNSSANYDYQSLVHAMTGGY